MPASAAPANAAAALEKSLPRRYYVSDEVYALERERVFAREWVCAGRADSLPNSGDYLALDVAGESVLVVRGSDDGLRAFYNLCRHRGSRLRDAGPPPVGRTGPTGADGRFPGAIQCPYHAWTYGLDGRLVSAPFVSTTGLVRKEEFPLFEVGLETWGGFLFVHLSPEEARARRWDLRAQLGEIPTRVGRYPLEDLRVGARIVYDVAANWKVLVENYNECYHCGPVHPELCDVVPAFRSKGGGDLAWNEGIPHRPGAWTFTRSGTSDRRPFPGLDAEERVRHKGELVLPNLMLSLSADHAAAFVLWPQGPQRTRVAVDFLFHPDEMARPGFDPRDAVDFWDLVNRQDWTVCERVQLGMQSRAFRFGYLAPMESLSGDIRTYLREKLGEFPDAD